MTWGNPPPFIPDAPKQGKKITPEDLAKSGSEAALQTAVMAWAALSVGKYPMLKYLAHIPNGGSRDVREGVSLKAQGVKRGIPDLMLPFPTKHFAGLFIEMKAGKGKPSEDQKDWLNYLSAVGYMTSVQWTWEGARDIIVDYLERT